MHTNSPITELRVDTVLQGSHMVTRAPDLANVHSGRREPEGCTVEVAKKSKRVSGVRGGRASGPRSAEEAAAGSWLAS